MENLTFDLGDAFEEAKERARAQGAFSREEWHAVVEEILEEKREVSEMSDAQSWQAALNALQARFDDFSAEIDVM